MQLTGALVLLSSCKSFETTEIPPTGGNIEDLGLPYFLPKGALIVRGEYQKTEKTEESKKYAITVSQVVRANPRKMYFLSIKENVMYDEKSQIKVQNGLLTSANAEPNDRTADVIKTVVGAVIDLVRFTNSAALLSKDKKVEFKPFSVEIDPFDENSCAKASKVMKDAGWKFRLDGAGSTNADFLKYTPPQDSQKIKGPVYPLPTPVVIHISTVEEISTPETSITGDSTSLHPEFIMPNPQVLAHVPIKRGFMTSRTTNITFSQGMPTEVSLNQPSPVLAVVKLPADIVKTVGEALPTLVKVENKATPTTALDQIKAENAMLEQRVKQLEFQKKLEDFGITP